MKTAGQVHSEIAALAPIEGVSLHEDGKAEVHFSEGATDEQKKSVAEWLEDAANLQTSPEALRAERYALECDPLFFAAWRYQCEAEAQDPAVRAPALEKRDKARDEALAIKAKIRKEIPDR